jgi:hypothetical protein
MPPPETRDESITAAIITTLKAITAGTTYHHTFTKVVRADFDQEVNFDALADPLIVLRPGEMRNQASTTRGGHATDLEIWATVAKRDARVATTPQFVDAAELDPQTVRARLTSDVRKALEAAWPTWAYEVTSLEVTLRDSDAAMAGWCAAHLHLVVSYKERLL